MTFSNCLRLIWRRLPFIMSQLASGFSSANLRSFFSPMRKYLDASSMESVYFCQIGISFVFKYNTSCKFARPLSEDGVAKNKRQRTDGCWHSSTGISPRPMLKADLRTTEKEMERLTLTMKHAATYRQLRPLYDQYRQSRDKEKFLRGHEGEIILFEAAARELKRLDAVPLPATKRLRAEMDELTARKIGRASW